MHWQTSGSNDLVVAVRTQRLHFSRLPPLPIDQSGHLVHPILRKRSSDRIPLRFAPDWFWEMAVVRKTRNDVPVQMRRDITQTGEVDLQRMERFKQSLLHRHDDTHQVIAILLSQVAHFPDMVIPDNATEARITWIVYVHDSAKRVLPDQISAAARTKFTIGSIHFDV